MSKTNEKEMSWGKIIVTLGGVQIGELEMPQKEETIDVDYQDIKPLQIEQNNTAETRF